MDKQPQIRALYPGLNDEQLREAENNLEQYLLLVLRIYERVSLDPEAYARLCALTCEADAVSCKASNEQVPHTFNPQNKT